MAFIRRAFYARGAGWAAYAAVTLWLMQIAGSPWGWMAAAIAMPIVYPLLITVLALRSAAPLRVNAAGIVFEGIMAGLFAEVLSFEPVYSTVFLTIAMFNAGLSGGGRLILATLTGMTFTTALFYGDLRVSQTLVLEPIHHRTLILYVVGYFVLTTTQVHKLTLDLHRKRQTVVKQKMRLEKLHQHLVETITNPYVADDAVTELVTGELSAAEVQQYTSRIRRRQHFEGRGRMLSEVVHDLRNLLQPIVLLADTLTLTSDLREDQCEVVQDIQSASRRATELLDGLVEQRHSPSIPSISYCQPHKVIREVLPLLRSAGGSGVRVTFDDTLSREPAIRLASASLHRILMNLGLNALQAMEGEGVLTVELQSDNSLDHTVRLGGLSGEVVGLSVRDTGPGISPADLPRVFEPYFTTRASSGGTGLGLATTHALTTDAGGMLRVSSELGEGTLFQLYFPKATD